VITQTHSSIHSCTPLQARIELDGSSYCNLSMAFYFFCKINVWNDKLLNNNAKLQLSLSTCSGRIVLAVGALLCSLHTCLLCENLYPVICRRSLVVYHCQFVSHQCLLAWKQMAGRLVLVKLVSQTEKFFTNISLQLVLHEVTSKRKSFARSMLLLLLGINNCNMCPVVSLGSEQVVLTVPLARSTVQLVPL